MTTPPKKPFNLHAKPKKEPLRDKDNGAPKPPPPSQSRKPAPNLAPTGSMGIRRGLPSKDHGQEPTKPARSPFALGDKGKLTREFKPLADPNKSKDHGHEH